MIERIFVRKLHRERIFSFAMIGLLCVGITVWMIVPSISSSLQNGFTAYADNTATYIVVQNTAGYTYRMPQSLVNKVRDINGVAIVFPIVRNITWLLDQPMQAGCQPGPQCLNITANVGIPSAVVGGGSGYPPVLLSITSGGLPHEAQEFIINDITNGELKMNHTYPIGFSTPSLNNSASSFLFNATAVGANVYTPLLNQVPLLWNSTLLRDHVGSQIYNQTFGGYGANFLIIKAQNPRAVQGVAVRLNEILGNQSYQVEYDQAAIQNFLSFQGQSGFLYSLVGVISLGMVISLVFLLIDVATRRRKWEIGLLVTQGWSWRLVAKLFFEYYCVLGLISYIVSFVVSFFATRFLVFRYQVFSNVLSIPVTLNPNVLVSGLLITILLAAGGTFFVVWRMRKTGLDSILSEF